MPLYSAVFNAVAIAAAQDLFEIVAPADSRVIIEDIELGQYTDVGDAASEALPITIQRGFTTSGSGGSSVTPTRLEPYGPASGASVEANNTTEASTGTPDILYAGIWNLRFGWIYRGPKIVLEASERLVVTLGVLPADAVTASGTIIFREVGTSGKVNLAR